MIQKALLKITVLLRHNSHAIQFVHSNGSIQWFLVYSQNYTTITPINFRTFSSTSKEAIYPLPVTSHFSQTPPYLMNEWIMKSLSRVQLFVTLWTVGHQAPLSMGFPRQEHWNGLPFPSPGESSRHRDWTWVSLIAVRHFNLWATYDLSWRASFIWRSTMFEPWVR